MSARFALPALAACVLACSSAACLPVDPIGNEPIETVTVTLQGPALTSRGVDLRLGRATEEGEPWDLRAEGWNLFLNGGESGDGKAGGIDMELLDLDLPFEEMNKRNQLVWFLFFDSYACALSDWWWYGLDGTHTLFSSYHTYVVRRGARDVAVQILDYYRVVDGLAAAGYPEVRWAEIPTDGSEPVVEVDDLDATAGGLSADPDDPANQWTYFSFEGGALPLTDAQALTDPSWDLGWKRFNVKSNSGASGPGGVVTLDLDRARADTADDVLAATRDSELAPFLGAIDAFDPSANHEFLQDAVQPVVRRWWMGRPGSDEDPARLSVGRWFLVTDRDGEGVAKLRVVGFEGNDPAGPESVTIEWGVLP